LVWRFKCITLIFSRQKVYGWSFRLAGWTWRRLRRSKASSCLVRRWLHFETNHNTL